MRFKRALLCLCIVAILLAPFALHALTLYRVLPDKLYVSQNARVELPFLKSEHTTHTAPVYQSDTAPSDGGFLLDTANIGAYELNVKLLGFLPLKKVSVNVYEEGYVIPGGETVGIRIYTDGVLTVALTDVADTNGKRVSPAKASGLQVGDVLISLNSQKIVDADHFSDLLTKADGNPVSIEYVRTGKKYTCTLTPAKTPNGYKIGAWVRDSTAGLGTLTFVRPDKGVYAALGHGIADIDTAQLLSVLDGNISPCEISSVVPGKKGAPGQLCGVFAQGTYGSVLANSGAGIYGIWSAKTAPAADPVPVASRFEIREGEAKLRFAPDGRTVREFDIDIEKVITSSGDEKSMVIRVTDSELLSITGGIVQGMSGSPILQDGKLIGAVTHVFVNDPTRGYGIFAELMMDKTEKIK